MMLQTSELVYVSFSRALIVGSWSAQEAGEIEASLSLAAAKESVKINAPVNGWADHPGLGCRAVAGLFVDRLTGGPLLAATSDRASLETAPTLDIAVHVRICTGPISP